VEQEIINILNGYFDEIGVPDHHRPKVLAIIAARWALVVEMENDETKRHLYESLLR
jgi:hypothetical protein